MFKDTFCSSPWIHTRLTYNGDFQECRWAKHTSDNSMNVRDVSIMEFYNSERMNSLRTQFLQGQSPAICQDCYYQDSFDKLSGRRRQLLKSGITDQFDLQLRSSPHYPYFLHSDQHHGNSNYYPTDLQIDLGNLCNSACIMCDPVASSRLQQDYVKLHKIDPLTFKKTDNYISWTKDALDKVVNHVLELPTIKYIHFLGGETLYDAAFYTICQHLIDSGRSKDIIIGTTTNGTIYDDRVEYLISQFKEFHLGISIESTTELNDYVRYPGKIETIIANIHKFLQLRKISNLFVSLRITPNIFTIYTLDKLFEFMIENQVTAESCNILSDPACLRIELLPEDIKNEIIDKMALVIDRHNLSSTNQLNTRNPGVITKVIANTVLEYHKFMTSYQTPVDADHHRLQLVKFIQGFEKLRGNNISNYVPRYKDFLQHYGY